MPYLTREQVEQTRMPAEWAPPQQQLANRFAGSMLGMGMGAGLKGQGQPAGYAGDPLGMVDPAALVASAQGGDYDIDGRRNAIAARLAANQAAQAAYGSSNSGSSSPWGRGGAAYSGGLPGSYGSYSGSGSGGGGGGGSDDWRSYWAQNYGADPNHPFFEGTEGWQGGFL